MLRYDTFQEAFTKTIKSIYEEPQHICKSRNGDMYEVFGRTFIVRDPSSFKFENENLGRIDYKYADDFYEWMFSTNESSTEDFKNKYPRISSFLEKPKSKNLPDNFNVLYGPRIQRQLPIIINELKTQENSRRAVLSILREEDLLLFEATDDSNLEFPCCDSATFSIRNNKLFMHLHMRSNNMGNVAKLDMYIWGRLMCEIAKVLEVELGYVYYSIVSAHIFKNDFQYFHDNGIIHIKNPYVYVTVQ